MLSAKQYLQVGFYAALILGAVLWGVKSCTNHLQEDRAKDRDVKNIIEDKESKAKEWQDNSGLWHHKSELSLVTENQTLKMLSANSEEMKQLKAQVSGLQSNLKNLVLFSKTASRSEYTSKASTRDTIIVYHHDTTHARVAKLTDKAGWYKLDLVILPDTVFSDLHTRDSLVSTLYWKRRWFLGRKKYNQEIISMNPHTKITFDKSLIFIKR